MKGSVQRIRRAARRCMPVALLAVAALPASAGSIETTGGDAAAYAEFLRTQQREAVTARQATRFTAAPTAPAGYRVTELPAPPSGMLSGGVAEDPNDPNAFYVTATETFSFFRDIHVYRLQLDYVGGVTTGTLELVASGTTNTGGDLSPGDNKLDNYFGAPSVAGRSDGSLLVVDNDWGTTDTLAGVLGDAVLLLSDDNGDGDFRDITGAGSEATLFASPIGVSSPSFGFTGSGVAVDAADNAYVITADGGTDGEVIFMSADGTTQEIFYDGLAFGAGVDVDRVTGDVYFGNATFTDGQVFRGRDNNANNNALDPGETELLATVDGVGDLAFDGDRTLYVTTNNFGVPAYLLLVIDAVTGDTSTFVVFDSFASGVALDSGSNSFAPDSATPTVPGRRMVVSGGGGVFIIEPDLAPASVGDWHVLQ